MINDNLGRIEDIDETSRNLVETGIQRKKGNKILNIVLASLAGLVLFALASYYIFSTDSADPALDGINVKKDEALQNPINDGNTLAAQMEAIRKQQAEDERLRKEAEEAERLRRLKEEQEKLIAQQKEAEINAIVNGEPLPIQAQQSVVNNEPMPETPAQRRLRGELLIPLIDPRSAESARSGSGNTEGMNSRLSGDVYPNGSARVVPNLSLLLIHGTQIPCVLITKLVTDHPSITICQVTKNIYSANGKTLLIERGSKVFGEQQNNVTVGQSRAFMNWSEIDTPNGIRIRINSLGTGTLGESGTSVWVDEKWGKRFGGAILLSFIQDTLATASQAAARNSSGTVVYENSESNTGRMAEIALENTINIQPTGYANQGTQINILVARDIDFSTVYNLK